MAEAEGARDPGKCTPAPNPKSREEWTLKLGVLNFRCGPAQYKLASGRGEPGPPWRRLPIMLIRDPETLFSLLLCVDQGAQGRAFWAACLSPGVLSAGEQVAVVLGRLGDSFHATM